MSNPPLTTPVSELDNVTDGIDALQVEAVGETSSGTKKTKMSARALLATISWRRISITELKFIGEGSRDGGAYSDVVVATLVRGGGSGAKERRVAVKKLRFVIDGDMTEEKFLRVFINELRVLDKLFNPHIVTILGFVEDVANRIAWLVFPWEENGNLREFLRSGEWEIPERVSLIRDVATGLEYLHTRQPPICHGDLKSLNILVNSANRAVITDFGSARIIRQAQEASATQATRPAASTSDKGPEINVLPQLTITTSNTTLTLTGPACSLRWSAPEILDGESLDLATDIWALGWVAWEATTDCYPFEEFSGEWDITTKIVEGRLPATRDHTLLSQIYGLCNMMQKCWKSEPRERPSVIECRQALGFMPCAIPAVKIGEESKIRSAALLLQVGEMHRLQDRHEEASKAYNEGLTIARLAGDQLTVGKLLVRLASSYRERSKYVEAEASYTEALAIFESIGDDLGRANALLGLGRIRRVRSKYVEAEASLTQALAIFESIGGALGRAHALCGLGHVQRERSKYVEAEASYTQALAIVDRIGDDLGRANTLFGLGDTQRERSKYVEAEASYTQAHAIYESFGSDLGRANAVRGLGDVQLQRSKYVEAEASYTQALAIYESIGGDLGRANALRGLGHVQRGRSKYVEAEASYTQAMAIYESIGMTSAERTHCVALGTSSESGPNLGRATAFRGLGEIQRERSKYVEAEASYTQALAIFESIGDDMGRAGALDGLGELQREQSKYVEAEASYTQALAIYQSIGYAMGRVNSSLGLGHIRLSQAQYAEARTLITDASIISEEIGYGWGQRRSKQLMEEVVESEKLLTEPPFTPDGALTRRTPRTYPPDRYHLDNQFVDL